MTEHPNYNEAVANLQRYLRQLAYWEENIPQPPVDGIFESRTEEALREYQRLRGLPVTGSADFDTWERLYADYRASLAAHSPPRQASIFPIYPENYVITEGSTGFAVTALQYMLSELRHSYSYLEDLVISGIYDAQTARAVQRFQRENGISGEGGVGLATWNAITDQYNTLYRTVNEE
jgi:peptidoglycan hydrolase-like protein with peptidoglycan-binding domain